MCTPIGDFPTLAGIHIEWIIEFRGLYSVLGSPRAGKLPHLVLIIPMHMLKLLLKDFGTTCVVGMKPKSM